MLKSIIAVDRHDGVTHALSMTFSVPYKNFDLIKAVRHTIQAFYHDKNKTACPKYINWSDFCERIPVSFQKQYNFHLISYYDMGECVVIRNLTENLIDLP